MGSSILYRVLEPIPDAATGLARARQILADLADGPVSDPHLQLEPLTTPEQFAYALANFPTAQVYASRQLPAVDAFLADLAHRGASFEREDPSYRFMIDLRLQPDLLDLWPLPDGMTLTLHLTEPFGAPGSSDEDDTTEEALDAMVPVLGPLTADVSWTCGWRGLPRAKLCGLQLCLNSVWAEQCATPAPGEFGLWVSIGSGAENRAVRDEWMRTCGLRLGGPQGGW
jgi:hypothetical protein